jgi:hypothetical protein
MAPAQDRSLRCNSSLERRFTPVQTEQQGTKIGIADGFAFSLGAFVSFSYSEPSQNIYTYEENAPKNVRFRFFPATLAKPKRQVWARSFALEHGAGSISRRTHITRQPVHVYAGGL